MVPPPLVRGLTLCDYAIVDQRTGKVSLIGTFVQMFEDSFPSVPRSFCAFIALTNGQGDATVELVITELETDEEIEREGASVTFPDKLTEVQVIFQLKGWSVSSPGWYSVSVLVDGEAIASRPLQASSTEEGS
ncbi:MAG TPA: hypothetical protein VFA26_18890 [Gemmataceae bacterium]|nr:hypothetical protein [Gemmataceae bacterium]